MNSKYTFTTDWVSTKTNIWSQVFNKRGKINTFLELGSYEGRSAIWFIENALSDSGSITCIDNWSYDTTSKDIFDNNITEALKGSNRSIETINSPSHLALANLLSTDKKFDAVYIDAGHKTFEVITDACMCWNLVPSGGIIIFDDYLYRFNDDNKNQSVKLAVDSFCNLFDGYFVYLYVGNQVIIQKK